MDVFLDGKMRGTKHDVWGTYLHLIKNSKRFLNGDISIDEAERLVRDGTGDVVIFGRYSSVRNLLIEDLGLSILTLPRRCCMIFPLPQNITSRYILFITVAD